ncbi:PREDICTED: uncharacterized protein LOC106114011 [Papilio xuthus]|uniref:Uncharacterized protein LOC106114011 n=1 Tax=Papilio xuthus TaxID=66420 RepID=A0AAJ7E4K7_PAPXU|nr:PREDICTED: uncharacterized protein LOC106114011 [Papilio xuthus]
MAMHWTKTKQKQQNKENDTYQAQIYKNTDYIRNKSLDKLNDITFKDIEINKPSNKDFEDINSQIQKQNDEINFTDNIDKNSQFEIVPFKIIEELNRLKIYLERKNKESDGSWSDSGYKSDSQSRSSFKSHQQTQDTLVNHSARSLINFILNSPLVLAAKEIVIEISWVLGRLIDKLYVEEKYFLFLEEVLSSIDNLLQDIYEGESYDEDVFKKDNNINRLFLLNRSNHIIKYTIEKITNILSTIQLTNDSLEINNIYETENLSYILHILECLLKRYIIIKNQNSQICSQSTEDEKYLKKSSISNIWRKKWNPNYKIISNDPLVDSKSIEIKCMEVLNKIIVQAMDGYSLISFAALQCFNLLQS